MPDLLAPVRRTPPIEVGDDQPLRSELFNVEQLERHAKGLAAWHVVDRRRAGNRLLARLRDNERVLGESYALISDAVGHGRRIAPAAEWILDNYYLIEEQIRTARRHLPRGYARELPRLTTGPHAAFPRAYGIALELIAHVDGKVDAGGLSAVVGAYQAVAPLTLGELWAVPIMLRLALIENLRRVSSRIAVARRHRNHASEWADRLIASADQRPAELILHVADLARSEPPMTSAFVAELAGRLQGRSPALALATNWLESRLGENGTSIEQLVQAEGQAQAADQVSIGNSIGSLRFLGAYDWREFVESMSVVERALRLDPADVYGDMDFATRDRYRHVVERIARRTTLAEEAVAARAVELAGAAGVDDRDGRARHVGWWLIGDGRRQLEQAVAARRGLGLRLRGWSRRHALPLYLLALIAVTAAVTVAALVPAWRAGASPLWLTALAIGGALAASQVALHVVNFVATRLAQPRPLPRLDYVEGVPAESASLVVVPSLLSSPQEVDELIERLEVRFLANRDEHLWFALLTDLPDAAVETLPSDEALVERAAAGIARLNEQHAAGLPARFFLLHRPRRFAPRDRVWRGWERKRGKLIDLGRLLTKGDASAFSRIEGAIARLPHIRYVITLDADTQLPRDSARQLCATMAHPLNRPVFDARRGVVVEGYAILQPRVAISLTSARRSWYARIAAGDAGIDPYTRAVSDVYQDLFGAGSFVGKGIYDLEAFERALAGRLPEERILSHDLLEGCYARSGLVSDVLLVEDHPSRYLADSARRHRWMRGDWQVAHWILPRVPTATAKRQPNPLGALARWKLADNLRRCLVAPAITALAIAAPFAPGAAWPWLALALLVPFAPTLLTLATAWRRAGPDVPRVIIALRGVEAVGRSLAQGLIECATAPFDAARSLDAIVRTLWRLAVSRRRLLEWRTMSDAERAQGGGLMTTLIAMRSSPGLAMAAALVAAALHRPGLAWLVPLYAAWFCAPTAIWWLSRPVGARSLAIDEDERQFLRRVARRTWSFFEAFVNRGEHWLPPDNYQEHPAAAVAHRTSPTNIGLSLLANQAAWDFGWLPIRGVIQRTEPALLTLDSLERYRGHLYNWYDTRTLKPLPPLYVSTVDSGNFAAHLLTARAGLVDLADQPILRPAAFLGLADVLGLARARALELIAADASPDIRAFADEARALAERLAHAPRSMAQAVNLFDHVTARCDALAARDAVRGDGELLRWIETSSRQARAWRDDLAFFAPWLEGSAPREADWRRGLIEAGELDRLRAAYERLDAGPTLRAIAALPRELLPALDRLISGVVCSIGGDKDCDRLVDLRKRLVDAAVRAEQAIAALEELAQQCHDLADMDFGFLYDKARDLFTIGFNVTDHRLDQSYYDLLASEARLASFLAIAQGQVRQEHWFTLGRMMTLQGGRQTLLSWSGSMFEYLMPNLVMPSHPDTVLDQTNISSVDRQIAYGKSRGVPWGISESGYNITDAQLNYQYRAFGCPGLGLKRGLGDDLVIAPYATALATMVAPRAAVKNLRRLQADGREGAYGFYEAVDYTPARLPRGATAAPVRSWMAHHQGMALLSIDAVVNGWPMQRRFMSDPIFKSVDLLLQERVPHSSAPVYPHAAELGEGRRMPSAGGGGDLRVLLTPNPPTPEVDLLSNGRYHVVVGAAGGGASRWKDQLVLRWREDATREGHGLFCYLRDRATGQHWSNAYQPTLKTTRHYEAVFTQARAEFRRRDHEIDTHTEIAVSPEDDVEIRRITITNRSRETRVIEFTSFGEVAMAPLAADAAHPAFSNLFVQTSVLRAQQAILCTRRARQAGEQPPWLLHAMALHGVEDGEASFETDRAAFVGRWRSLATPRSMDRVELGSPATAGAPGALASPLDPVVAIRRAVRLEADQTASIDLVLGMADTREQAVALIEKYRERRLADRVFDLAWTHSQVVLRQLGCDERLAQAFAHLAGAIIFPTGFRRAAAPILAQNRRGQSALWGYGISGDNPIVLLKVADVDKLDLVRQTVQAHAWWRLKGLAVDLVIVNEDASVYRGALYDQIVGLIAAGPEAALIDKPGGVFVRRADQIGEDDRILLQTLARIVLSDANGPLLEQADRHARPEPVPPRLPARPRPGDVGPGVSTHRPDLRFFNGHGGFTQDGKEYIVVIAPGRVTPAPWVNVIANPFFGTVVSEAGSGYTWLENSHEFRLTPWSNDPVCDPPGEALYLRDEDTGQFWSPTPLPARAGTAYTVRHGFGYSVFECRHLGIETELWIYVAMDAPVKFALLTVRNRSGRARKLTATGYWEWVLGELRHKTAMHIVTDVDARHGVLTARNAYSPEFPARLAFVDVSEPNRTWTGDRAEFLGRNGALEAPAAMGRAKLSNRVGPGLDPCAALQAPIELADGQSREICFTLGVARDSRDLGELLARFRGVGAARAAREQVWTHWNGLLSTVRVETPHKQLDVLANGWLPYQALGCRMWARTGFYQSGGAFGFRDQLQDAMALAYLDPVALRNQILRAARHQFREGDVQHWWHPPQGRGVRTHFSDDYLWLPAAVCRYVGTTGDTGVLAEKLPFLDGRPVASDEEAYYDLPVKSDDSGTLYEHCVRAIRHGLRFGEHGLPLIGCGDWNDGMNRIGTHHKGESVWLAFFLGDVLKRFGELAAGNGDPTFAEHCATALAQVKRAIEEQGWDGEWYRRAYFDDGRPLGSKDNDDCQIDAIPQSWAVLSGLGEPARARQAMAAVDRRLVRRDAGIIQLFDPPFDKGTVEPGYIKGYVPGVRENGGQYTHAALWTIMGFAELGERAKAWELFQLVNPVNHARTAEAVAVYKVEPYVACADVYAVAPHVGRGGWTWYTGSAGWMYRLIVETFLGLRIDGGTRLRISPKVPDGFGAYVLHYRFRETPYRIAVAAGATGERVVLDGTPLDDGVVPLVDDQREHVVEVR